MGDHDEADVPLIFQRVRGGTAHTDFSGMGNGGDETPLERPLEQRDAAVAQPRIAEAAPPALLVARPLLSRALLVQVRAEEPMSG